MAGSWEITEIRRNRVLAGLIVPTEHKVTLGWCAAWSGLQLPPASARINVAGMPYGPARNSLVATCLEQGFGWVYMHDSDVIAPPDAVLRLMATGRDIISGVYRQRFAPWKIAAFNRAVVPVKEQPGSFRLEKTDLPKFHPGDIIPADYVPAGCLLISRRALETVRARYPKPFEWTLDIDKPGAGLSEDYDFCEKARSLGIQTWLHTGIDCQHEVAMTIGASGLEKE